jgi:methanogenic corrinoid protein MtbC1
MADYLKNITKMVTDLGLEDISPLVQEALDKGEAPSALLQAMSEGMVKVGEIFEKGEYFLADLVIAGEIMKEGLKVIEPHFKVESFGNKGTVVLCTVKGDIHDIGKNLVGNMLTSCGFRVVDLGVDVHEDRIVEAVRKEDAHALALSVLLTPMVQSISDTVSALSAAGLRETVKIAIGGACTTPELARRSGVDAVGRDPVEAVKIFESFLNRTGN